MNEYLRSKHSWRLFRVVLTLTGACLVWLMLGVMPIAGGAHPHQASSAAATEYHAEWRVIECVCSDEAAHRARLAVRERGIPGWHELTWEEVERVKTYYAKWKDDRLVIDAVKPLDDNVAATLDYIRMADSTLIYAIAPAG